MERFLQFNSTAGDGSPLSPSSSEGDTGRDAYEFVAFVAWYLFLILFCVVPTACAYRRRRLMERRLARQTYLQRMAANGLLFMGEGFMHVGVETEAMQMARMQRIETEIRTTTMVRKFCALHEKPSNRQASYLHFSQCTSLDGRCQGLDQEGRGW